MFAQPNVNPIPDMNTLRALEQLATVLNDVEQRLQLVRVSLAQALPQTQGIQGLSQPGQMQSTPFGISPGVAGVPGGLLSGINPYAPFVAQNTGIPQGVPPSLYNPSIAGLAGLGAPPQFGVPGLIANTGVNAPTGFAPGATAPSAPFRFG